MKKFTQYAADENNENWSLLISRKNEISKRESDVRSEFFRDYTRIINSRAYRRLKHKTQVFFDTSNDHVCTRIEHVNNVVSISFLIAKHLGLNEELVMAIASGHDLGHSPFGHSGERIIDEITKESLDIPFWHEKNSLRCIDYTETIQNAKGEDENLNLTYAVRDGIVTHSGEMEHKNLKPRKDFLDLENIPSASFVNPYTFEGCVVKTSDIIAYLGRDIEDAIRLDILQQEHIEILDNILKQYRKSDYVMNNTTIIYNLVTDLCSNSTPEEGISFSPEGFEILRSVKEFNYKYIYKHERLKLFEQYARLIIHSLYDTFLSFYPDNKYSNGADIIDYIYKEYSAVYPQLAIHFSERLRKFSILPNRTSKYQNEALYNLTDKSQYKMAVVDYISSMTDMYAIKLFEKITSF